jgi:hypothetical protein
MRVGLLMSRGPADPAGSCGHLAEDAEAILHAPRVGFIFAVAFIERTRRIKSRLIDAASSHDSIPNGPSASAGSHRFLSSEPS